ncbi:MAG: hypothetical protein UR70_C0012G0015 [Candidatus Nomurabacteria bacterium GW2011_GWB1_35_20]|uniref:Baseplate protein J-like domain-containing protein n=2 Tax=Candidatus Nomuraibacteriota TaxID=1752729 RepID=A0A0G0DUN9_9BACT|nr:MAG: hypothetical protein UR70_C0012G0015 [Candidatus Nomurabacteria bacterium GW2011_GWB1_35_20]KKP74723.1 MAG: hypothetical protein UR72_C0008G0013 [Parcubacteria group bacterium GW2011_GWC1_35_21]KKP77970.1 MAG: hypothetical protein UR77_C0009G0013 [Candidatus Nomurabacteria bacterium GW2011_GWC2_35_35]KKP85250.1 MAG: hypothetical protein UR86_C0010G0003 [Parcubacteria group bacterium GW2011_GWD2_35_7]KKP98254.1 MAG: hypothetical protein US05_C0006G0013 [Candidatus Nomurabacteria bacteriu
MPRNLLQDMVRKAPAKRGMIQREKPAYHTFSAADADGEKIPDKTKQNSKGSKYRLYFVALISVIFLLFALSFLFSSAKVVVTPKVKEIPLNENLSAAKDSNTSSLSFDLVVISGEENKIIQGGEEKDVVIAAKGTVLIYNAYSSSSQTLDIDTRLEGSNGKIYKTSKKITVPGMTKDNKPGSIEVGIYGAETGEEYNSVPLDFKIFGFRGTPKYSKFYARSKGEITGGFKGKAPVVSSLDKATAVSELETTLKAKLLKKATDQIPSGFILFKDAIFLDIDEKDVDFTPDKDNQVSVNIKGTLYGFIFNEKKLTAKIAQDIIDKYDGSEIYIPNIRDLTFSFTDKENISFADVKNIGFTLSGIPKIVYKVNEEKFTADLLNKKKKDFNQILAQYPNISSAELIFRPFWKASFPEKSESIEIIVNYPK